MALRDFQQTGKEEIFQAWNEGALNVMPVFPTGSGKTVLVGDIIQTVDQPTAAIAHRQELVGQLALALNREGVAHGLIAPKAVVQQIIALEMETHGRSAYNPRAPTRVASVDTIIKRDGKDRWFNQVKLAVIDEGHHVLKANKWGSAMLMLPEARGLFPTAHCYRADGAGLGRQADGLVDRLVIGPCGQQLIERGLLCDYDLVVPTQHLDLSQVPVGSTGDYNYAKLRKAVHDDRQIVGDLVGHYMQFTPGKLGITFAVDVDNATDYAKSYQANGVSAEVITADTPISIRSKLMKKFRARQILMLVSVDVLGEGVDVPAVEVICLGRPTASFQLRDQQVGRGLRLMLTDEEARGWGSYSDQERLARIAAGPKPLATIIDAVGNIQRFYEDHGLPGMPQKYSTNRRERATREGKSDVIPLRNCLNPTCFKTYPAIRTVCPYCGDPWVPSGRSRPDQVDGDVVLLGAEALAAMRDAIRKVDDAPLIPDYYSPMLANTALKNHREKQAGQVQLRKFMMVWGGWLKSQGMGDSEIHKRFFFKFGTDVMTAQTLGPLDANALESRIRADLSVNNVVEAT